jgi:hypothetical protein
MTVLAEARCGSEEIVKHFLGDNGQVYSEVIRTCGDIVLKREKVPSTGRDLIHGISRLVIDGELFSDSWSKALKILFYIRIVLQWPGKYGSLEEKHNLIKLQAIIDGDFEYLIHCLDELGIKEPDDLSILDGDDLIPNLAELTGLTYFDMERLYRDFPYHFAYNGASFKVGVFPKERKVELYPENKEARKVVSVPSLVIPPFGGFSVFIVKGKQSRRIR